jgi:hypothetical protein
VARPRQVSTSTVKKSVPARTDIWEAMKSFQVGSGFVWAPDDPVSTKDVSRRLIGDGMAEIGKRSDNLIVSPTGVLSAEADNERLHLGRDWGPAWS